MAERAAPSRPRSGFQLRDGAALVLGAAIASVHLRGTVREAAGAGWVLAWIAFAGVALTAAGPFELLVDRMAKRSRVRYFGETLWCVLGLPWIATTILSPLSASPSERVPDLYSLCLTIGVAVVSLLVMCELWKRWIRPPLADDSDEPSAPWTHRVGLALSVCWPLQSGFVLIVLG
jgi:hypothetical protein